MSWTTTLLPLWVWLHAHMWALIGVAFFLVPSIFALLTRSHPSTPKIRKQSPDTSLPFNRRRSPRLKLSVPVMVYGWASTNSPFTDIANTLSVNVHGGLLDVATAPEPGELLMLVNTYTDDEQKCRVVHVGPSQEGKRLVGFELTDPGGWFWRQSHDSQQPATPASALNFDVDNHTHAGNGHRSKP